MRVAPCVQCVRFRCHQSCLCGARSPTGRFLSQRLPHGVLATEPREGCFPGKWGTGPRPGAPLVVPSPDLLGAGVRAGGREGQGGHSAGASHTEPLEGDCPTVSVTRVSVHASAGRGAGRGQGVERESPRPAGQARGRRSVRLLRLRCRPARCPCLALGATANEASATCRVWRGVRGIEKALAAAVALWPGPAPQPAVRSVGRPFSLAGTGWAGTAGPRLRARTGERSQRATRAARRPRVTAALFRTSSPRTPNRAQVGGPFLMTDGKGFTPPAAGESGLACNGDFPGGSRLYESGVSGSRAAGGQGGRSAAHGAPCGIVCARRHLHLRSCSPRHVYQVSL